MTGRRILVIDDDAVVRALLRALLGQAGAEVAEAAEAGTGLALLAEGPPPDAVLLDVTLPDADGWEVLARIRAEHPGIPVLMLTGHRRPADAPHGATPDDYVTKPFEAGDLRERVGRLLA